jgi:hypothetical protein
LQLADCYVGVVAVYVEAAAAVDSDVPRRGEEIGGVEDFNSWLDGWRRLLHIKKLLP